MSLTEAPSPSSSSGSDDFATFLASELELASGVDSAFPGDPSSVFLATDDEGEDEDPEELEVEAIEQNGLNRSAVNLIICRNKIKCNACWRIWKGKLYRPPVVIFYVWFHSTALSGADDARKILNNDGTCPICDQVLSKSHMKPMDINPGDDWTNMAMAKFTEKLEEVHTAYQKMVKRCKLLEQENENLNRDKHELQEKFAEKSR
uniref:Uncharacterized protein n=1 Tax=Zea mays TaxID=4577 RepID=A0A804QKU7_MAIZE